MTYVPASGITPAHFGVFQRVASQLNRIIIVRNTNTKSTHWIELGYPPKPKSLEALHTSDKTGKVTALNESERQLARMHGFYVLEADGLARRSRTEALIKRFPMNTPDMNEPGQVIHPQQHKALVGDYDLQAVIDPAAKGRIIALATTNYGEAVANRTNPDVDRVIQALNAGMDQPRVMHGPHDLYKSFKGACTAFMPNGLAHQLTTESAVREFYDLIGRQTMEGSYKSAGR